MMKTMSDEMRGCETDNGERKQEMEGDGNKPDATSWRSLPVDAKLQVMVIKADDWFD
jgi:hypothetical protein